jgi:hypothetical protein
MSFLRIWVLVRKVKIFEGYLRDVFALFKKIINPVTLQGTFDDKKRVMRSCKSKDRQYNCQRKKNKQ